MNKALTPPADPDDMNEARTIAAEYALVKFMAATYTDREDALADLLCNLMHWCDRNDADFAVELARAQNNYLSETDPNE